MADVPIMPTVPIAVPLASTCRPEPAFGAAESPVSYGQIGGYAPLAGRRSLVVSTASQQGRRRRPILLVGCPQIEPISLAGMSANPITRHDRSAKPDIADRLDFAVAIAREAGDDHAAIFPPRRSAGRSQGGSIAGDGRRPRGRRIAARANRRTLCRATASSAKNSASSAAHRAISGFSIRSTARSRSSTACRCTRRSSPCCAMASRSSA